MVCFCKKNLEMFWVLNKLRYEKSPLLCFDCFGDLSLIFLIFSRREFGDLEMCMMIMP